MRGKVEYLAAKGNHDADGWDGIPYLWSGSEGYEKLLKNYGVPKGAKCKGQYGVDMSCEYKGILFVISSVGVERSGESSNQDHYYHLENSLKNSNAQWKICVWHMTMEKAQVSYKGDATGWGCLRNLSKIRRLHRYWTFARVLANERDVQFRDEAVWIYKGRSEVVGCAGR